MPSFKFIGAYPRFYPQERDSQGQSLMAELGAVVDFEGLPPSDGQWILIEDGEAVLKPPEVEPEAPQEPVPAPAPEPEPPAPLVTTPDPEPAPVPEAPAPDPAPAAAAPVPAPQPETPNPEQPFMRRYVSPYARA